MAVIIDDQAQGVRPLNIRTGGSRLDGIATVYRRAEVAFKATKVTVYRTSYLVREGDYVAVDTGTESVKVRIGADRIFLTVSSVFSPNGPDYHLENAGEINSVIVNGVSVADLGPGPYHPIEISDGA